MLIHHTCVFKRYIYIVFADHNWCETEPSELYNSLGLGLHQISPFLVDCMIKVVNPTWPCDSLLWVLMHMCMYIHNCVCIMYMHTHIRRCDVHIRTYVYIHISITVHTYIYSKYICIYACIKYLPETAKIVTKKNSKIHTSIIRPRHWKICHRSLHIHT